MQTIAAFDLGIKNLSYCVTTMDASGSLVAINRWANLNLLADGADSQSQTRCSEYVGGAQSWRVCGGPASYQDRVFNKLLCKKCARKSSKPILDIGGTKLADWRAWAQGGPLGLSVAEAKKLTKVAIETKAAEIRLMPYKPPKAKGVSLQAILEGMETCLTNELGHLVTATRIRIENQPSEFAPHMKSVQIMLFTLLDHRLRTEKGWKGTMEFVNAGIKTRGCKEAGVGKEAKRSRKIAAIVKVDDILRRCSAAADQRTWWLSQAKQDDLADAFLMCLP